MILTSLAGFQSSSWWRSVTDRRVNQAAFNLVEKLHGPAPIIIMSSFHSVWSPRLSIRWRWGGALPVAKRSPVWCSCFLTSCLCIGPVTKPLAHNYLTFWCRENVVFNVISMVIYWKCSLKWCNNHSSTSSIWFKVAGRVAVLSLAVTIWCCGWKISYPEEAVKTTALTSFLLRYADKLGDEPEFFSSSVWWIYKNLLLWNSLSLWPQSAVILR